MPLTILNFVCCLFPFFFFSALLLWLPFALHVLSGCGEKLDVNYGRSQEMDLDQSNLVPRVFVPLDQWSENESSGSNHFEITE